MIFKIGLLFHIIGIILIAGGSIGNLVVERLFWKFLNQSALKFQTFAVLLARFPRIILTGSMLMLASGVLMLYGVNWEFIGQAWLTIKFTIYVILVLNGMLIAKPTVAKIVAEAQSNEPQMHTLLVLKKKITKFHIIQFTLLFLIIAVAIFKI